MQIFQCLKICGDKQDPHLIRHCITILIPLIFSSLKLCHKGDESKDEMGEMVLKINQ